MHADTPAGVTASKISKYEKWGLTIAPIAPSVIFSMDKSGAIRRDGELIDEMSRDELLATLRATLEASGLRKAQP